MLHHRKLLVLIIGCLGLARQAHPLSVIQGERPERAALSFFVSQQNRATNPPLKENPL